MKKILFAIVLMALSATIGWIAGCHSGETAVRTTRVVVVDTIPYYQPVAVDSVVVRYVKVLAAAERTPAADAPGTAAAGNGASAEVQDTGKEGARDTCMAMAFMQGDSAGLDSVVVTIPIMQKKYETERYRAYVSGYEARLDSIFVYDKIVTERITLAAKPPGASWKPKIRFGVSTGVGYGLVHKGFDTYFGFGLNLTW